MPGKTKTSLDWTHTRPQGANTHTCQATDEMAHPNDVTEELKDAKANARHARRVQAQARARIVNPRSQAEARAGPRTRLASEREHTDRAVRTLHRCRFGLNMRRTRTTDNARTREPDAEKNEDQAHRAIERSRGAKMHNESHWSRLPPASQPWLRYVFLPTRRGT